MAESACCLAAFLTYFVQLSQLRVRCGYEPDPLVKQTAQETDDLGCRCDLLPTGTLRKIPVSLSAATKKSWMDKRRLLPLSASSPSVFRMLQSPLHEAPRFLQLLDRLPHSFFTIGCHLVALNSVLEGGCVTMRCKSQLSAAPLQCSF